MAEGEAVAAGELRRHVLGAGELVDHLAFGQGDVAEIDGEAELLRHVFDRDLADADLADEGVAVAVAALHGIAEAEHEALVAARHRLQADIAIGGEGDGLAGEIEGARITFRRCFLFHKPLGAEDVGHARHVGVEGFHVMLGLDPSIACRGCAGGAFLSRDGRVKPDHDVRGIHQRKIEEPVGIVIGRTEHLAAGQILVGRGDAAADRHLGRVERLGRAEARQRRAIGPHQEGRLDRIALRLLQRQRREIGIVERALVHDAAAGETHLLADLRDGELRHAFVAATRFGDEIMGGEDGGFAAFDRDIHQ